MDKNTLIKVTNRESGRVGYTVEELGVRRQFAPRETKEIRFEELEKLSFLQGGLALLRNYLIVRNEEAMKALGIEVEPEYYYTEEQIKNVLLNGTMDEFLDCLDFAPDGVIDSLKRMAVELPLNDVQKRDAILEKIGFNVTKAIEIKNTKYDGDSNNNQKDNAVPKRRAAVPTEPTAETVRRTPPKYKVVMKEE